MNLIAVKQRYGIIGNSSKLNHALETAIKVASTDMSVLINGESGVGKESFSKIIHQLSSRKHGPFIAVNCGAIPEGTIDSELFGHEKGAFTGAIDKRKGYFESANGGTIFLDEVGELPLSSQARLLRILENGEFIKVGSSTVQKTNVRIVAATNKDLLERSSQGKFREDLYYRLSTVPIRVPKLSERKDDIYILFRKFAQDFSEIHKSETKVLDSNAQQLLKDYTWPGNIRQLKNITDQICVLEQNTIINAEILSHYLPIVNSNTPALLDKNNESFNGMSERDIFYKVLFDLKRDVSDLKKVVFGMLENGSNAIPVQANEKNIKNDYTYYDNNANQNDQVILHSSNENSTGFIEPITTEEINHDLTIEQQELQMIKKALIKYNGKRRKAAQDLGISERTLYRKIKQYDLE